MSTPISLAVVALALAVITCEQTPPVARDDAEYCRQLADLYERYVGGYEMGSRMATRHSDPEGALAVVQCRSGDLRAIPVLERKLLDQGFTLPRRA